MDGKTVYIVGAGLSGAAIARVLAENGKTVHILEKRDHIGGNMYDYVDEHGILVHRYGPHTFHTRQKYLFDFMNRFADWMPYRLTCGAEINGKCTPTPFNFQTVDDYFDPETAAALKERLTTVFAGRKTVTVTEALGSEDPMIRDYAQFLFDNDYSLYTAKQWGVSAAEIDPSVLKRVPLRLSYEVGYFDDEYQVMPQKSYTAFFENLLCHPNITVTLKTDALNRLSLSEENGTVSVDGNSDCTVVYTGPLDSLMGLRYGQLPYRSLRFEWHYETVDSKQDMPVVAYPQAEGYTRIVEYKKLPCQVVSGTTYEVEYSLPYRAGTVQEPYYPVLTEESAEQYRKYSDEAKRYRNLFLCGRLADFKYYNMDQALEHALLTAENILKK